MFFFFVWFVLGQQNVIKKAETSETRPFELIQKLSIGEAANSSEDKAIDVDLRYRTRTQKLHLSSNSCSVRFSDSCRVEKMFSFYIL